MCFHGNISRFYKLDLIFLSSSGTTVSTADMIIICKLLIFGHVTRKPIATLFFVSAYYGPPMRCLVGVGAPTQQRTMITDKFCHDEGPTSQENPPRGPDQARHKLGRILGPRMATRNMELRIYKRRGGAELSM